MINNVEENTSMNAAAAHKEHQERMLACLSTLSLFSKAKPDLMVKHAETLQPYLSMNMNGPAEQQVMNQVLTICSNLNKLPFKTKISEDREFNFSRDLQMIFSRI